MPDSLVPVRDRVSFSKLQEALPLPDLVGKDKALGDLLAGVHQALNFSLLVLVILHVAAALQHHFIERQPFLQRMGWGRKERT